MPALLSLVRTVSAAARGIATRNALMAAAFLAVPALAFAQGAMTNGEAHTGAITFAGEIQTWTFTATAGDYVALSIGETGGTDTAFVPWIQLFSPAFTALASQSGTLAAQIGINVATTGTYTVQVRSNDAGFDATGTYVLTLAKGPGAFVIPAGDTGGALTNGSNHAGSISAGDFDMWSFTATTGDYVALSLGEVPPSGADPGYRPWIRLVAPNGQLLGNQSGDNVAQFNVSAPQTGTYTVIVGSFDTGFDASGDYQLTLAKGPGAFVISDGDQGGALTNGSNHAGSIHQGDLDMWSFTATTGDYVALSLGEVPPSGADPGYRPWIRLVAPNGALLGNQSGDNVAQFNVSAPQTGTYTVIVGSFNTGFDATGDYLLTLAKGPGAFVISGGDQGGALTNGSNHAGSIHQGDLDMWSFTATAGDYFALGLAEVPPSGADPGFQPWIRVVTPDGTLQGNISGVNAAQFAGTAPLTGTYTVIVGTFDSGFDATGDYVLTLARAPGAFVISNGDEGGPMTNGANHAGVINRGDLDMWTFTAGAGEQVAVSVGEVLGVDNGLVPWLRLVAPNGALLANVNGAIVAQFDVTTTVAGTYTVILGSVGEGFGNYLLTLAKTGGFVVPVNDEGGPMTTSVNHSGAIHVGDMDQWSFFAHAGNALTVSVSEDGSDVNFNPWIRLRSPTGVQLGSQSGAVTAQIVTTAPLTGYYTVVVATSPANGATGQYFVSVNGNDAATNLIQNGDFSNGTANWLLYATPDLSYIVSNVTNGVLNYYRVPQPTGPTNQAVAFQETGVALATDTPLLAQFDLANTSTVRKRISVLVIDSNFSDITVCTFWLAPNAPMRTYQMKTHTTKAWTNAALYFYAASANSNGGFYQVDNVSLQAMPNQSTVRTDCVDPTAPAPPGGADSADMLVNGNFDTGSLAPWFTFGTITSQLSGGVFEFIKPTSVQPSGVIVQPTSQAASANEILTAQFELGNSSFVRKRVTVLVHDNDFSDLAACTFWLPPNQPLTGYAMQMFATKAWTNATVSVYPATVGFDQWIRLDNVSLRRTPSAVMPGTACLEPGAAFDVRALADERSTSGVSDTRGSAMPANIVSGASAGGWISDDGSVAPTGTTSQWEATATASDARTLELAEAIDLSTATSARLLFKSWLTAMSASAEVQVRVNGGAWLRLQVVPPSDTWVPMEIDLRPFVGGLLEIRFVLNPPAAPSETPDVWRVGDMEVEAGS